jgi:plastocyanin
MSPALRHCALTLPLLLLSACSGEEKPCNEENATATTAVEMKDQAFRPNCITVAPGTQVGFVNLDEAVHTVVADPGQTETFNSGNLNSGESFQHTFATAGTFTAHCDPHPEMTITILVK